VLPSGSVTIGGGLSGQLALQKLPAPKSPNDTEGALQQLAVGPGVAPWAAGRMGLPYDNEAGLTYAGRTIRLDGRHAFSIGKNAALSLGLGGSVVLAKRPGEGADASGVYGGGADVPLLIGIRSSSDLYSIWFGPRGGFEVVSGRLQLGDVMSPSLFDASGKHFYGGLVAGLRVGFRHVHLAIELDAAYHHADGTFRPSSSKAAVPSTSVQQISLTPAGALEITF
jgi:hypothetical protein